MIRTTDQGKQDQTVSFGYGKTDKLMNHSSWGLLLKTHMRSNQPTSQHRCKKTTPLLTEELSEVIVARRERIIFL